jgi:16S rRNA pseudouridine516 synthase
MSAGEALDRFLTRRWKRSWADARLAIHQRRVAINSQVSKRYHVRLRAEDLITLDGVVVEDGVDDGVVLCHKPLGYACSHEAKHQPLLYDLVPGALAHPDLQAAGRLDRDTTGLLVLTIDGPLIQRLTAPKNRCRKRYRLRYQGVLASDSVLRVAQGLQLTDDPLPCLPAELIVQALPTGGGHATLVLAEGRFHQVKRMILALGGEVTQLHRERIGGLELPADLAAGAMRPATAQECAALLTKVPSATAWPPLPDGTEHPDAST